MRPIFIPESQILSKCLRKISHHFQNFGTFGIKLMKLGPFSHKCFLFLAYINDLPNCVSAGSQIRLFADDSVICRVINNTNDAAKLQQDLDALQKWKRQWLMEFHPEKCQVLDITKRHNPVNFTYTIHGHPL